MGQDEGLSLVARAEVPRRAIRPQDPRRLLQEPAPQRQARRRPLGRQRVHVLWHWQDGAVSTGDYPDEDRRGEGPRGVLVRGLEERPGCRAGEG